MTQLWMELMGGDALPWSRGMAKECIASEGWADLSSRCPTLA